jgi:hypothetical protein
MRLGIVGPRARWATLGGTAAGIAALLYASTVLSQPTTGGPVPQRVRELEERVAKLELRLLAVERALDEEVSKNSAVASFDDDDQLGYSACDPPFVFDAEGSKLLKAGCEAHGNSDPCDPPFIVDAEGIKTLRAGCVDVPESTPCDPPYSIDRDGFRVLRRGCLDVGY